MQYETQFGWGLLIGLLLTVPLIALMYLADQLVNLPFVPFNLFDWTTRMLPGDLITFGIDTMISGLLLLGGTSAVGNAKAAEQLSAVLAFLTAVHWPFVVYFLVLSWRRLRPSLLSGVILGALVGLPLIMINYDRNRPFPIDHVCLAAPAISWLGRGSKAGQRLMSSNQKMYPRCAPCSR